MNNLNVHLLNNLKTWFSNKDFSDATITIIEELGFESIEVGYFDSKLNTDCTFSLNKKKVNTESITKEREEKSLESSNHQNDKLSLNSLACSDEELIYVSISEPLEDIKYLFEQPDTVSNEILEKPILQLIYEACNDITKRLESISRNSSSKIYCSIPVYLAVLKLQSDYFENFICFSELSNQSLKEIKIRVNTGNGIYLKYFIESFYNHDIFDRLSLMDLLALIKVADYFCCDQVIERIALLITLKDITCIEDCDGIAQVITAINAINRDDSREVSNLMVSKCRDVLQKSFFPLENQKETKLKEFFNISFKLLKLSLETNERFVVHENSLLYYVSKWLEYDLSRQSEENIKSILQHIKYKAITPEFLYDVITEDHEIFNKWKGYLKWFIHALGYHSFNPTRENFCHIVSCNADVSIPYKEDIILCRNFSFENTAHLNFILFPTKYIFQGYEIIPTFSLNCSKSLFCYDMELEFEISNMRSSENDLDNELEIPIMVTFVQSALKIEEKELEITEDFRSTTISFHGKNKSSAIALGKIRDVYVSFLTTKEMVIVFSAGKSYGLVKELSACPFFLQSGSLFCV